MSWLQTAALLVAFIGSVWAIVRQLSHGVYEIARFVNRVETIERVLGEIVEEQKLTRQRLTQRQSS
jgi:hypothetical protein